MPDTSENSATRSTRIQHEFHTSDTNATQMRHKQHECDANATRKTRVRHDWKILILLTARVKAISHPYIYYMASERLQGWEQFHTKTSLLKMSRLHAKMRLKSAPQKLNFLMTKAILQRRTLGCSCKCPCTLPHSYAQ